MTFIWGIGLTLSLMVFPLLLLAEMPSDFQDDPSLIEGMDRGIKGDYQGAIAIFSTLIRKYPTYAEAYFNRGIAKGKLKDYAGAIADYTKAIALDQNLAEAYQERGLLWQSQGQSQKALQDWQKAAQLYQTQRNEESEKLIKKLIESLKPKAQQ